MCRLWVHARCSGVKGPLKRAAETFKCKRCDCMPYHADSDDEELVGYDVGKVDNFVYLGDKINSIRGCSFSMVVRSSGS